MSIVQVYGSGQSGIVRDVAPHELPPEYFSDGRNVRFRDGAVVRMAGETSVLEDASFTIAPYGVFPVPRPSSMFWVYAGLDKVYATSGGAHSDITRVSGGDYTGTEDDAWTYTILGGVPIFCNGVDAPQFWAAISGATPLANMTNWPANTTAKVVKAFGSFAVALNLVKSSVEYPSLIKWSHPADPNALPVSWDETDPDYDAGEKPLDGGGAILDGATLGKGFFVYQESKTSVMRYIGGSQIFSFDDVMSDTGIMTTRCVASLGVIARHFVVTGDDIILVNGQDGESVANQRIRRFIFNAIDGTNFRRAFTVANVSEREVWFCFPETGETACTLAAVWSWVENTWSFRELSNITHGSSGIIVDSDTDDSWDADTGSWDDDTTVWNQNFFRGATRDLLLARPTGPKLLKADYTTNFVTGDYTSYVERRGLALIGRDRFNQPKVDPYQRKLVDEVWIRAKGAPFYVYLGATEHPNEAPNYGTPQLFTPGQDVKVNLIAEGRYICIKFQSASGGEWTLNGYDMDVKPDGTY